MLKSSVRLLLAIVRAKPRLALAPKFKDRIVVNIALFNIRLFINKKLSIIYNLL